MLMFHGFIATQACLVFWLSKPSLLSHHWLTGVSYVFSTYNSLEPLDESEGENEKVGFKVNIQKTKIMASGPITSWQIDGETVKVVTDYFWRLQMVTAAMKLKDAYSLEEKLWPI